MITKICYINSPRSLLLYFLITDMSDYDNTFLFTESLDDNICNHFSHYKKYHLKKGFFYFFYYIIKFRFFTRFKYPFINSAQIYGQDNLIISSMIGNNNMILLEEGLMNYRYNPKHNRYLIIKKLLFGPFSPKEFFGRSKQVSHIILTGLDTIPSDLLNKVKIVNFQLLWDKCEMSKKDRIFQYFGIDHNIREKMSNVSKILFTQPLSEDGAISEDEKINIYKKIISTSNLAIKPHPRELTDYHKYFPGLVIIDSKIPVEFLLILQVKLSDVYTIFSTAALNFLSCSNVHFCGTKIHPKLVEKFGDISMCDGKIIGMSTL